MSTNQIHPASDASPLDGKQYKAGIESLKLFNVIRQTRHQSKESTIVIQTPKNSNTQRAFLTTPKRSQFTSQDQIIDEEDDNENQEKSWKMKFSRATRKLIILQHFFRQLIHSLIETRVSTLNQVHKKRKKLPFLPNELQIWKQFMNFQTFLTLILYPIYIAISDPTQIDTLTIIIICLDILYFIDVLLKQITCQIDSNYNLISTFQQIFLFNLRRWLIFDLLSILPYKFFVQTYSNILTLNILKLFRYIKYFSYNEKQIYQENSSKSELQNYFENIFILEGKLWSLLKIFKNMLILISLFGCLFYAVQKKEDCSDLQDEGYSIYITGIYWALQTVTVIGYGDIPFSTSLQFNLTILWIFIGVGFYSFTIGNLATILEQSSTQDESAEQLDGLENLFQSIAIPDELCNQCFAYFTYNIENNPYWNYKKIIETFPAQLRLFAIAFCSKNLIENINMFSVDITFAADILPNISIYCYKQYETIYLNGSPSLEVYFLIAGEVRLCDSEGNTLLNIQEGYIFGEIEILEDNNRKQSAIAGRDSIVIMCPVFTFLRLVSSNDSIMFELEQLGLRRKLLLTENQNNLKKNIKQIKRQSAVRSPDIISPYVSKKQSLESIFKKRIIKDSYQQIHKKLMRYIFGSKQEKKWKYQAIFKMAVRKILDHRKSILKQQNKTKRMSSVFGKQMIQNFAQVREKECEIQRKIRKNQKDGNQKFGIQLKIALRRINITDPPPFIISPYYFYDQILKESKEEKLQYREKQSNFIELSKRLIKINPIGQIKIFDTLFQDLQEEFNKLKQTKQNLREIQQDLESEYYTIGFMISQYM